MVRHRGGCRRWTVMDSSHVRENWRSAGWQSVTLHSRTARATEKRINLHCMELFFLIASLPHCSCDAWRVRSTYSAQARHDA